MIETDIAENQISPDTGRTRHSHGHRLGIVAISQGIHREDGGHRFFVSGAFVGWDQRRFAAPAHHDDQRFHHGGPALEASLSHPTLKRDGRESSAAHVTAAVLAMFRVAKDRQQT